MNIMAGSGGGDGKACVEQPTILEVLEIGGSIRKELNIRYEPGCSGFKGQVAVTWSLEAITDL